MSLVWGATSIYRFIRAEQTRRPIAHLLDNPQVYVPPERPSALRPLFADMPTWVRRKGLPASEVGLATDVRAAEERGGEALWRSHQALGVHPTTWQSSASDSLKRHVPQGREIDGWLMKVNWLILRDQVGSSKYDYTGVPPAHEVTLRFPDDLAGYEVWLWGSNYDFGSRRFTCPNNRFEGLKDGDWVRVFGVLRMTSRIEWEPTKEDELLSLGELIISDIQKADAVED